MQIKSNQIILNTTMFLLCCILTPVLKAQIIIPKGNIQLVLKTSDKDSSFAVKDLHLKYSFSSMIEAEKYLDKLTFLMASKGFPAASLDSIYKTDSSIVVKLFVGSKFEIAALDFSSIEKKALTAIGINTAGIKMESLSFYKLQNIEQQIINYYENNGYPFAAVYLDSISFQQSSYLAQLKVNKGIYYAIDSISVMGKVKIKNNFLQHYLNISNNSGYSKLKLQQVDKRISELPFLNAVQPSELVMLGSGAILNLYLQPKKSNQVNFLIGLMPASGNSGKLLVTGDVNLDLKNTFGTGERIFFKWQQLQPKSPRLNLGFTQPNIFRSSFGLDFLFELFKKDSNFLQINTRLGLQYNVSPNQIGKLFLQWQSSSLLPGAIDTSSIKSQKRLPDNADMSTSNLGINYEWNNTNYRINPISGNEFDFTGIMGIKKIIRNNEILNLKDNNFDYSTLYDSLKLNTFQISIKFSAAHYFPIGKFNTLKTSMNTGLYFSPDIFRNDLFQIGGYKILRGFDEESIYATQYGVFSAEYRLIFGQNSYLSFFSDYGITNYKYRYADYFNQFIGAGLGFLYETKAGLLNLNYAIGKRNDVKFNIREASKIHFGYVNYF